MKKQNYSNHKSYSFGFYFVFLALIILSSIGSFFNLILSLGKNSGLIPATILVSVHVIIILFFFYLRKFSLSIQDRAIRAEENLRHYVLTGKLLDSRLHMNQIIALRFAPDSEFTDLVREAADRQLQPNEIKKLIKRWKGDYHRI